MKISFRAICPLLLLLLALCLFLQPTQPQAASESNLTFTINSDGQSYSVTDCSTSASGALTVPATYNGKPVTTIGSYAFYYCSSLTSVTIGDSVTTIGNYAFYNCYSLTSVTIPNSVTTIGNSAFYDCDSLTSVIIPDSVTTIDEYAFAYCDSLTSVTIGDSVTTIGYRAFEYCRSLTSVIIPDSVTTLGDHAFEYCRSLTSVTIGDSVTTIGYRAFYNCRSLTGIWVDANNTVYSSDDSGVLFDKNKTTLIQAPGTIIAYSIPDSVTTIGYAAFEYCSSLTSVTIPDSVTTIGDSAFYNCSSLTSVTIPNSVTTIGDWAFSGCSSLTSVTIPSSVTIIDYFAFSGCSSLTSVTIPDSVTTIGGSAFSSCSSLTSVTIPNSVITIGEYAFSNCSSLTGIWVDANNTVYSSDGSGVLFDKNKTTLIQAPGAIIAYSIPDSVTTIGEYAFSNCSSLTSVTIPSSVTTIGYAAFEYCSSLKDAYYSGTEEQWNAIEIAEVNTELLNATIHFGFSAPEFTQQPQAVTVEEGEKATFAIAFSGDVYLYRWQYSTNGGKLWYNTSSSTAGYNTDTLTVVGTEARNGFMYRCKITDKSGNVYYSDAATLTVKKPGLSFVSHPADETVKLGNRAAFTIKVDGDVKAYQWQYQMVENGPWWNCTPYTMGYNTTILNVIAAEKREGFLYRCRVTDSNGNKFYSNTAELTVDIPETYAVLSQPQNAWVMSGKKTTFHLDTQGEGLTYQWEYHKGVDKTGPEYYWIAMGSTTGCKTDTLTIAGVSGSTNRNGWAYRCVVTDANGYIYTTDHAFLYVTTAQITSQPADQAVLTGSKATFAVKTEGTVKSYQWQYSKNGGKNWFNSSSATQGYNTATLTVEATAARNGFMYRCIVTDSDGNKIESHAATLSVANAVLVSQPTGVTTAEGSNAVFSVTVEGNVKSYRWQYSNNGGKIWYNSSSATQGYNTDTLTVEATAARNGFLYRCVITDSEGNKITSEAAKLTVQ